MASQPRNGFRRVEPPRKPPPRVPEPELVEGSEPTDEQLCNVAVAAGFPILATPLMRALPYWRESLLNLHSLFQRAICGDVEAGRTLERLGNAFGSDRV